MSNDESPPIVEVAAAESVDDVVERGEWHTPPGGEWLHEAVESYEVPVFRPEVSRAVLQHVRSQAERPSESQEAAKYQEVRDLLHRRFEAPGEVMFREEPRPGEVLATVVAAVRGVRDEVGVNRIFQALSDHDEHDSRMGDNR